MVKKRILKYFLLVKKTGAKKETLNVNRNNRDIKKFHTHLFNETFKIK